MKRKRKVFKKVPMLKSKDITIPDDLYRSYKTWHKDPNNDFHYQIMSRKIDRLLSEEQKHDIIERGKVIVTMARKKFDLGV